MQNQYFGDVNDYRKYGLLRCLSEVGFHIGVCWMITPPDKTGQGQRTGYLSKPQEYRFRDPDLFDFLQECVFNNQRSVHRLEAEAERLLPGARFFSETLPEEAVPRGEYFKRALAALRHADVLFFDPNIGLERRSKIYGRKRANYLYWREVETAARHHASVVIFQHRTHEKRQELRDRLSFGLRSRMPTSTVIPINSDHVLLFAACQPAHLDRFTKAMKLLRQRWNDDMEIVDSDSLMSKSSTIPDDPLAFIQRCVRARRVHWTYHVNMRLSRRHISRQDIYGAVDTYDVVEAYPDDKYLPSYLVLATMASDAFHVLFAADLSGDKRPRRHVVPTKPERLGT